MWLFAATLVLLDFAPGHMRRGSGAVHICRSEAADGPCASSTSRISHFSSCKKSAVLSPHPPLTTPPPHLVQASGENALSTRPTPLPSPLEDDATFSPAKAVPSPLEGDPTDPAALSHGEDESFSRGHGESCTTTLAVGFYNVVLSVKDIKQYSWTDKQSRLNTDIDKAFKHHELDVLCLSAIAFDGEHCPCFPVELLQM